MTDDYYRRLAESKLPGRPDGWRHHLEQLFRFQVALDAIRPGDQTLLDLGCGHGLFFAHLRRLHPTLNYTGADINQDALESARSAFADARFETIDYRHAPLPVSDVVVAVGTLVDGKEVGSEAERRNRVRGLIRAAREASARTTCIVVLDQEIVLDRPALYLEPALFGATRDELHEMACTTGAAHVQVERATSTDLALYMSDDELVRTRTTQERFAAVMDSSAARTSTVARRAWLAAEVGLPGIARSLLRQTDSDSMTSDPLAEVVLGRLQATD